MEVRPFALLSDSAVSNTADRFSNLAAAWAGEWALPLKDISVSCLRANEERNLSSISWRQRYGTDKSEIWFAWTSEFETNLQRQIFPPDAQLVVESANTPVIASAVGARATSALVDRFLDLLKATGSSTDDLTAGVKPRDDVLKFASGAVVVKVRAGVHSTHSMTCLLDYEAASRLQVTPNVRKSPLKPVEKRESILGGVEVTLSVEIGSIDVEMGSLLALTVGDVVRLDTPIDQPLSVVGPDGHVLFQAHLGKRNESMAIEVVRRK